MTNRVAESSIITLDLADYYPREEVALFDLKDFLFMGLILKEKDFREAMKNLDTSVYTQKLVAITCTADAIIPVWAYMLVASYISPVAKDVFVGSAEAMREQVFLQQIAKLDAKEFEDKRVVIKGCGETPVSEAAYVTITRLLRPVAKSIMYGEPCSTVPIFKKSNRENPA